MSAAGKKIAEAEVSRASEGSERRRREEEQRYFEELRCDAACRSEKNGEFGLVSNGLALWAWILLCLVPSGRFLASSAVASVRW